ncbi:DNA topology modulation kinase FlaR [Pseudovibrio sp. FO-BEG1]|uniref:DNA topology modulation protein FlaR n=1 Tax=Pseudovibrio sp. (strain FO-BEG1) TaxID=911045 RepID=UPI000238C0F1|nr:DNA topology modulation protein FlaR [Pseudovibrio sp. FO-BEG1]AEV36572.1 DNA topology modulation kinase FlaR [Pseudovibrio sp. FO-BEG1]
MQKLIVTGANGAGKSFVAARLSAARPEIPLISFDKIKLTSNWQQRPRADIEQDLEQVIAKEAWILEGGPSLLDQALPKADAIIWLDPPLVLRAWRLLVRPWHNLGKTRAELPAGNFDWPAQQYRFAFRSLRNSSTFQSKILDHLEKVKTQRIWHCRTREDIEIAVNNWRRAGKDTP